MQTRQPALSLAVPDSSVRHAINQISHWLSTRSSQDDLRLPSEARMVL
jgi:hypothetical protein